MLQNDRMTRKNRKPLDVGIKLNFRTAPELHAAMSRLLLNLQLDKHKFFGRVISMEAVMSAVVIDFLDNTEDDQVAIILRNVSRFEEMMTEREEESKPASDPPAEARSTRSRR
jgi:hypothetical protein